jgi:hypothetical protein
LGKGWATGFETQSEGQLMTATLYELVGIYKHLAELAVASADDNEDGAIDKQWLAAMEHNEEDIKDKLAGYAAVRQSLKALSESLNTERQRLRVRQEQIDKRIDHLSYTMLEALHVIGAKSVQAGTWTIREQVSPPSLNVFDLAEVPTMFDLPVERKLNTKAIRDCIKGGFEVPGVELLQSTHLRVS